MDRWTKKIPNKPYRYTYEVLDNWGDVVDGGVAETTGINITEALDYALQAIRLKCFRFFDDAIDINISKIEEIIK